MGELEAGFAKLQGEDFEYYMQTYSIVLGRNSKQSAVDVDLASLGGGKNISRQHARIYYDFDRKRFAMEVLGKNGCYVEGVLYVPDNPPVKLDSQDLLQIGDKKFYFLLPTKKIVKAVPVAVVPVGSKKRGTSSKSAPSPGRSSRVVEDSIRKDVKKQRKVAGDGAGTMQERKTSASRWHDRDSPIMASGNTLMAQGYGSYSDHKEDFGRRRGELTSGLAYTQAEEREAVAAIASVLSDLCGPGEWMPMTTLYTELQAPEHYSTVCSPTKVWKVLDAENGVHHDMDGKARPWGGLLNLLRKYPEHFIINIKVKGRTSAEYVSLVSLVS